MIIGVGIDVVEVARLERRLQRVPALRDRLFTEIERDEPIASLAGRFAAKEALAKSLGAPPGMSWLEAEVRRGEHRRPELHVSGEVAAQAERLGVTAFHLSISHDGGIATAIVIAERGGQGSANLEARGDN